MGDGATGDLRKAAGEVEPGGGPTEAELCCVEGSGGLLGRIVGPEPDPVAAVGQADLRDPLAPLPLPHSLELEISIPPLLGVH